MEDDVEELEILILGLGGSGAGCWEDSAFSEGVGWLLELPPPGIDCVDVLPNFASLLLRI